MWYNILGSKKLRTLTFVILFYKPFLKNLRGKRRGTKIQVFEHIHFIHRYDYTSQVRNLFLIKISIRKTVNNGCNVNLLCISTIWTIFFMIHWLMNIVLTLFTYYFWNKQFVHRNRLLGSDWSLGYFSALPIGIDRLIFRTQLHYTYSW